MLTLSRKGRRAPRASAHGIVALLIAAGAGAPMQATSSGIPCRSRRARRASRTRPAPPEVVAYWKSLAGTWIADNSQYKSDLDTLEAYGIQWTWGLTKKSMVGRLYGIKGGKDVGHRARLEGDVHTTASFNVDDKGVWKARRSYVWRRQGDPAGR